MSDTNNNSVLQQIRESNTENLTYGSLTSEQMLEIMTELAISQREKQLIVLATAK
jgi:hypothetical protein